MGRGLLVFGLLFLVLPLVGLALVAALPGFNVGIAIGSLTLLAIGFTFAFAFTDLA